MDDLGVPLIFGNIPVEKVIPWIQTPKTPFPPRFDRAPVIFGCNGTDSAEMGGTTHLSSTTVTGDPFEVTRSATNETGT